MTEGAILVDGVDVRRVRFTASADGAHQETMLFDDTIGANIASGVPDADRQRIEPRRAAHADEFVSQLPGRYDAHWRARPAAVRRPAPDTAIARRS